MSSKTDGLGAESHRQVRDIRRYWQMDLHIIDFGWFVDNEKNIEYPDFSIKMCDFKMKFKFK